jgi:protein-disulfide isomerase
VTKHSHQRKRPTADSGRLRWILFGGLGGLALVIVVVLIVVARMPKDQPQQAEVLYRSIEGGFTEEGFPYLGSLGADVVLVEFTDFYCSHCRAYNQESEDSILDEYVATGQVRYILHYYSGGSPQSIQVAEAAMCAAEQGRYFQFQRAFFDNPSAARADLISLARGLGLDEDSFIACWDEGRYHNELLGHIRAARAAGISATPSFKINDQLVTGNVPDEIRQAIEDELAAQ